MKIFVTRRIPGDYLSLLKKEGHEIEVFSEDRPIKSEELVLKVKGVDGLLSLLTDRVDADLMDAAGPQLKVISNYAVGFDNIDLKAASDRGIVVCNTPCDEVNEAVAEHTWALILSLARRIVEADESVRRGGYKGWEPNIFLGTSLIGKTLGIIGLGRIGSMVARRAKGYNMKVLYNKHEPDKDAEKELGVVFSSLDDLLKVSDFVSLHVPLTDETRGMINIETLAKMKKGSFLINTARGPIVCEDALVKALDEGTLKGAALDVYENEPNIHPELLGKQNVVLTPHIASSTNEAREKMSQLAVEGLLHAFLGKKPLNMINPEIWNTRRK
jgi:glyoxylate reductase